MQEVYSHAMTPSATKMGSHVHTVVLLWGYVILTMAGIVFLAVVVTEILQGQQDGSVAKSSCCVMQPP